MNPLWRTRSRPPLPSPLLQRRRGRRIGAFGGSGAQCAKSVQGVLSPSDGERGTAHLASWTRKSAPTDAGGYTRSMEIKILADADAVAQEAARFIAAEARAAVTAHGRFV